MSGADYAALQAPHEALLRAALEAESPSGARVALDLACGPGAKTPWLAALAAPGALVLGLDRDRGALRTALPGCWAVADAHALPLRAGSVDLAWCVAALGLFADQELALAELRRVLRPGGTLVVAVAGERWVRLRPPPEDRAAPGLPWPPPPADGLGEELGAALARAGLRSVGLAAYLLEPAGMAPRDALLPLVEVVGAEPCEPEPLPVLLVAAGRA